MKPTEEQLTALGNYRDVINQHLPEIAKGLGGGIELTEPISCAIFKSLA